jgi:chorismate dehydratase
VRSVILFSREPLASLNGATIALSEESFSSVILLRILLKRRFGLDNIFVTVAQDPLRALKDHKAALMIGDAALFFESDNWIYKYDLGEMWKAWTGAPFVFSLWAVRRVFATENPREVRTFCDLLKQNLERNLRDPEVLLRNALGVTPVEKRSARMLGYFENLRYGLDREMIEGLSRFYALAFEEKLAPEPRPLEFFR